MLAPTLRTGRHELIPPSPVRRRLRGRARVHARGSRRRPAEPESRFPPARESARRPAPADASAASEIVVLVVDDEVDVLDSVRLVFEVSMPQARIITAQSGAQALDVLQKESVNVIVADYKMPEMDGIEFLVRARSLRPAVPRLMFSAYANPELQRRAFTEALVTGFIAKGTHPEEIVTAVRRVVGQRGRTAS